MSAICSKCKDEPAREGQRWGAKCIAAYMRDWRKKKTAKFEAMKAELARRGLRAA